MDILLKRLQSVMITYIVPGLLFLYIVRLKIVGLPTNFIEIIIGTSLVLWLFSKKSLPIIKHYWLWLLLLGISLLSGLWQSQSHLDALGIIKSYFVIPIIFAGLLLSSKLKPQSIIFSLFTSAVIVSMWGIGQRLGWWNTMLYQVGDGTFQPYLSEGRIFGPFESPNYLAMYLVPIFLLSVILIPKLKILLQKIVFGIALAIILLAIYWSGSQGGWISIMAGMLLLSLYLIKKQLLGLSKHLIGIGFVTLVFLGIVGAMMYLINHASGDRTLIYQYSWQMIKDHPVMGIGLGSYQEVIQTYPRSQNFINFVQPFALHPHNLFYALWLNLGLLGLIAFVGIISTFFYQLISNLSDKNYWSHTALLSSMVAILVHGLVDTTYFKNDLAIIFWILIALQVNYTQDDKNTSD